jgi:hypothetical protein
VDEIGAHEDGQVGPVVDDERDAEAAGELARLREELQERSVRKALLPQLHEIDAPTDGRLEERGQVRARARDQVQAGLRAPNRMRSHAA